MAAPHNQLRTIRMRKVIQAMGSADECLIRHLHVIYR